MAVLVGAYYYVWIDKAKQQQFEQSKLVYALISQTALTTDDEIMKRYGDDNIANANIVYAEYKKIFKRLQTQPYLREQVFEVRLSQDNSLEPQAVIGQGLSGQFINLSQIAYLKQNDDTYVVDDERLTGFIPLSFGHGLMVHIKHPPMDYGIQTLGFWLPIMLVLPLFLLNIYRLYYRNRQWQKVLDYAYDISSPQSSLNYRRLIIKDDYVEDEFKRLSTALNRLFFQIQRQRRALFTHKKFTKRLIENAPIPMALVYRSGHLGYVNAKFRQLFHLQVVDNSKLYMSDFIMGVDKSAQSLISGLTEVRLSKQVMVVGLLNNRHYLLNMTPWFSEHGRVQGFTVSLTDVDMLATQISNDTQMVGQLNTRLQSFDKLWSMMGHELRTPLSGILGMLELFGKDSLNNEQKETFATVEQTAEGMLNMLNDMLDMAKMDAGKLQINHETTDILTLCRQVCELMVGNARRQGIELLYYFATDFPRYISTDSARLRQILMNLLSNAIKFTNTGYVALIVSHDVLPQKDGHLHIKDDLTTKDMSDDISSQAVQTDKLWLRFSVQDTGMGISKEEQSRLFTFFNQANNRISSQFGGTGLGLAISKSFTQMMNGTIELTSMVGQGSDFSVYLPYQSHNQPVYQFSTDLSGIGLYVITSQHISAKYLRQIFNYIALPAFVCVNVSDKTLIDIKNQQQQVASSGLKSVLLIEHEALDDEALTVLSQLADYQNMPKILLSMQPERIVGLELLNEFDGFLNKPLDMNHLVSELIRLTRPDAYVDNINARLSTAQMQFNDFMQNYVKRDSNIAHQTNHQSETAYPDKTDNQLSILLAEDNPINQMVAKKVLNKLGYDVIIAKDGQEALDKLAENRQKIALILMDCRMPIKDGLTASREIRQERDSIPIIALTANATDEDRKLCLEAGMNDFLTKPVKTKNLEPLLNKYLA